jgi:hypothetical protein
LYLRSFYHQNFLMTMRIAAGLICGNRRFYFDAPLLGVNAKVG